MEKNVPCYGCDKRKPLCHGSCEEYKAYAQDRADMAKMIRFKRNQEAMVTSVLVKAAEKTKRNKPKQSCRKG